MIVTSENYGQFDDAIGGKARSLFKLKQVSSHVPDLFAVSSAAYRDFISMQFDELTECVRADRGPLEVSRECQRTLDRLHIDETLRNGVLDRCEETKFYSVRSSALQEDSVEHSFAGLFETTLFVPKTEIVAHLKKCWLSAFNPNIIEYCRLNKIDPLAIRMGVVVQEMIDSVASGVVFTANPAGSIMEVVIVAGYGLGEGVVSNKVETDTYVFDKISKKVEKDIGRKTSKFAFDGNSGYGVVEQSIPEQDRDRPVLNDEAIAKLLKVAEELSDSYTSFLDIEWAIDDTGKIHILQSRPITTIPRGKLTVFDNSNIVESYPGITLPLTFSMVQKSYEVNSLNLFLNLNLTDARDHKNVFRNLLGYVQGRMYYNLTNWYEMGRLLPLPNRFTFASFESMIGIPQGSASESTLAKKPIGTGLKFSAFLLRAAWKCFFIQHYVDVYRKRFARLRSDFKNTPLEKLNNHELMDLYHDMFDGFLEKLHLPLSNDFFLMLFTGLTKKLLKGLKFEDSDALFNGLMCGEEGMESVLPVYSVLHLAQMLRENRPLFEAIGRNENFLNENSVDKPGDIAGTAVFLEAFWKHIDLYGNRCPQELKMEVDTYKENPSLLLDSVLRYVPLDLTVEKLEQNEHKIRKEAERQIAEKLWPLSPLRLLLNFCVNRVRLLLKNRESARLERGVSLGMFRLLFSTLGNNLQREHALDDARDIFYLTVEELDLYVYGSGTLENLRDTIERRKKQFDDYQSNRPEGRLFFSGTIPLNFIKQQKPIERPADGVLRGVPCSPGKLECEAVVVHSLHEAGDVSGKIIVAKMTDPGWVFLMIAAAGIIVEKGSILSHTAIVGRELGIPTIVGIKDATELIKTGQVLKMDAYSGEVELLDAKAMNRHREGLAA